jgi:hypothetical protein
MLLNELVHSPATRAVIAFVCSSAGRSTQQPRSLPASSRITTVGVAARPSGVRCDSMNGFPASGSTMRISSEGTSSTRRARYGMVLTESLQPSIAETRIRQRPGMAAAAASTSGATTAAAVFCTHCARRARASSRNTK